MISAALQQSELFSSFSSDFLQREVFPLGTVQTYQKGQFLLFPQDPVEDICLVLSGRVLIQHIFIDGSCNLMGVVPAGAVLGADLACTRTRIAPYHAMAAVPTRVFWLPIACIIAPGSLPETERQEILQRLLRLIANQNVKKDYRLAILARRGLRERILTYLTMQAGRRHSREFTIPFTREELASFLCVNRSALSHELSRMEQEGLISFRKNQFTLHTVPPEL